MAILGSAKEIRRLPSWIDAFEEYTADLRSPALFRKWSAISALAGAMEQKLWVKTAVGELYPNLYVVLVGPPGVGKTLALNETSHLWRSIPDFFTAPDSLTKSALVDTLAESKRKIVRPAQHPPFIEYHSLAIASSELSDLLPAYDPPFMSALQSLYDRKSVFHERRRGNNLNIKIPNPQLNLLAATTPSFLTGFMPEGSWDQGFASRTILVYSGEATPRGIFDFSSRREGLLSDLIHDIKVIASDQTYGKIGFEEEAAQAISEWDLRGGDPKPTDLKLTNYNTRRTAHLLKLCMVAAVSRADFDFVVGLKDYQRALDWLIEVETYMPEIFKTSSGGDSQAVDECWSFCYNNWIKTQKPMAEHRIVEFLHRRVYSHSVMRVLEVMVRSKILELVIIDGKNYYKPAPKKV